MHYMMLKYGAFVCKMYYGGVSDNDVDDGDSDDDGHDDAFDNDGCDKCLWNFWWW